MFNIEGFSSFYNPMHDHKQYDLIPDYVFGNDILDVGAGSGENQIASKHQELFQNPGYLGIDINPPKKPFLNIIKRDVLTWDTDRTFDTVLAVEFIEHMPFRDWFTLFPKLKALVSPNGYLVITTEYNEKIEKYLEKIEIINPAKGYYQYHNVFGITEKLIEPFLSRATYKIFTYSHFRVEGDSLIWALARFVKRVITRHPYAFQKNKHFLIIWRKSS